MAKETAYIAPRNVRPFKFAADQSAEVFADLSRLGIGLDARDVTQMSQAFGMDGITQPTIGMTGGVPVQFLQTFLSGFVHTVTQPTRIDDLVGVSNHGSWEDEDVIQGLLELTGTPQPYGDHTDIPLSSWNVGYERRTVVRFEEGLEIGKLEEARSAKADINTAEMKRNAAAKALNVQRNSVGFLGYNSDDIRTYGMLNDPALANYITVAEGAGDGTPTQWSGKTYLEVTADIRAAFAALRVKSGDTIDPANDQITFAIASTSIDYLTITSDYGNSVMDWLTKTYPNVRVKSVPEFNGADGGENVFYLYAESVSDSGSDDGRVWTQIVPTLFQMLGSEQGVKSYKEDYTNATAGVLLKRPYAVVRYSGV